MLVTGPLDCISKRPWHSRATYRLRGQIRLEVRASWRNPVNLGLLKLASLLVSPPRGPCAGFSPVRVNFISWWEYLTIKQTRPSPIWNTSPTHSLTLTQTKCICWSNLFHKMSLNTCYHLRVRQFHSRPKSLQVARRNTATLSVKIAASEDEPVGLRHKQTVIKYNSTSETGTSRTISWQQQRRNHPLRQNFDDMTTSSFDSWPDHHVNYVTTCDTTYCL